LISGQGSLALADTSLGVGVGPAAAGSSLTVTNGGRATATTLFFMGFNAGNTASATVSNGGMISGATLLVGFLGDANLQIQSGGTAVASATTAIAGGSGSSTVAVSGTGANLMAQGGLLVGGGGNGTLTISGGGVVSVTGNTILAGQCFASGDLPVSSCSVGNGGPFQGGSGSVTVTGGGSALNSNSALFVGQYGLGSLTISDNGTVSAPGGTMLGGSGGQGTINIGAPASAAPVAPGTLQTPSVTFGGGNDLLVFNHTDTSGSYVFSPVISGPGAVNVLAGVTTLTAINTYTGPTTVNGGALLVDGSIASSSLTTVNSGALLGGTGTVGPTVIQTGGTLAPGHSPGTITVAGNLAFQSGAFYLVQVTPSTASLTNVTGTASLAGTVQAIFAPGTYGLVRSYTILTAAGGRIGTFDALTTSGLPADFQVSLSHPGNTAVLSLTAELVPEPPPPGPPPPPPPQLSPLAFTVNQLNVGHAIDNFFNNGGALPPAFLSLFNLTGSNLTRALDQLSGEPATGAQKVGFQLTNQFLDLMLDPFVDGRCGISRSDQPPLGRECERMPSALGFAPERETMPPAIALAYASVLKEPRAPLAPVYEPRWTAWGGAYGGSNRTSGDIANIGSHDLSASTVGFAAGLDYRYSPDTVLGFALAGGGTNWSLAQGLGGGKSDAFQAGLYGATKYGPAYLAAAFAFANHWMSTDRNAVGDHLTADFNAQSYGGRLEGGYRFAVPYVGITPYAAIQAQDFHTPSYNETGIIPNGFALAFGSRDATDTRSELGARFDRVLAVYSNAVLALRGRLAWAHDWVSDPTLMPLFQSLPGASFIVNGASPAKNSALTSAGAELRLASGVTLLAKFDGEFASHSSTYAGTGTLRYRW
jgi:T5SS/PEP-CTERM-associated repeat protein/autotransporter-associated beta strand protein